MSKATSKPFYIPPFVGIHLVKRRDYITLVAVASFREFFAYGKVNASEVTVQMEDGRTEPFWDHGI